MQRSRQEARSEASKSQTVIYRSRMHPVLSRNSEVFPVLDWLADLAAHIPNPGERLVRYSGGYSNAGRGKRKKAHGQVSAVVPEDSIEAAPPALTRGAQAALGALHQRGL